MMLYAQDDSAEQSAFKAEFKSNVRKAFWAILTSKYDFYKVVPHSGNTRKFVKENFMLLNGKIYTANNGSLILALEKACDKSSNETRNDISMSAELVPVTLSAIIK
jgi:hypothetical protein